MNLCPLCQQPLTKQPTVALNYTKEECYGYRKNKDGSVSEKFKCGYYRIMKDGNIVDELKVREDKKAIH